MLLLEIRKSECNNSYKSKSGSWYNDMIGVTILLFSIIDRLVKSVFGVKVLSMVWGRSLVEGFTEPNSLIQNGFISALNKEHIVVKPQFWLSVKEFCP